jgi:pyruvate/2-oxoglutarate/acetoin dehydrogenase E1 component
MGTPQYSPYKDALTNAMTELAKLEDTIFIGQQIVYAGNPMSTTLGEVPKEKMIEVPVMEETQMGMSLGLAITGKRVVTFYPRWDFIVSAANQLINHVDKFELMTGKKLNLIIRLGKGSDTPLDPGHQHKGNYFEEFKSICKNIEFHDLKSWQDIELAYKYALKEGGVHLLVEYPELYYKN